MTPSTFLVTYRPLLRFPSGREAIARFHLPPYIDYSCRKEPDFLAAYPSITALCRAALFAPRLHPDDVAIYLTVKGQYPGLTEPHWRLTAILRVLHRFESHADAAQWYRGQGLPLPSNCLVPGNPPWPIEKTAPVSPAKRDLRRWDAGYQLRARANGVFLACAPVYLNVVTPPAVSADKLYAIFGRIPGTRNPPRISLAHARALAMACDTPVAGLEA